MADEVLDEQKNLENQDDSKTKLEELDAKELINIIKETRTEAKQRRLKEKELEAKKVELEAKLNEFTKVQEQELESKKLAEGKKDEVIEDLKKQLGELNTSIDSYKASSQKAESYMKSKKDKLKEVLKDDWLPSFDNMPLEEVETIVSKITAKNIHLNDSDNGTKKKKSDGEKNPFSKENFNLTAQIELRKTNPKLAEELELAAKK